MAVHFHTLKVKEIKKETADCVSILLEVPEGLKGEYTFQQGQNITLKKIIEGKEVRRSYSICAAPFENELRVAVKKVDDGLFSTFANTQLKTGDELEVLPPTGKFNTALDPKNKKQYTAFAAGSGITPILSIIKTTLATEPVSSFTLVYGNKNSRSIIFFEELEAIKNTYMNRFTFINILSREKVDTPVNFGRIDADKMAKLSSLINFKKQDEYFICGPEEMIFCVKDFLEDAGIDKKKIHFELFTTSGKQKAATDQTKTAKEASAAKSRITIKADGRTVDFDIPLNSDASILDAALQQGADLPYACKGGMCCTCKAKLLEGEVQMDVNWGLEHDEVEQGFILTCQSHPKTERVVVDFDVK